MRKKYIKALIAAILTGGCICAGSFCIYKAFQEEQPYIEAKESYEELRREVTVNGQTEENTEKPDILMEREIDFDVLKDKNEDIIAWLYIPGTPVDYPVCRGKDSEFYLHHNAEKEKNILGSLFVPPENNPDLNDTHIIIYGHNMKQGQMFGELSNYEDEDFFKENPYVYLYTPQQNRTYLVYSVYRCEPESLTFTAGFLPGTKEYMEWQSYSIGNQIYVTGAEGLVNSNSRILTLATCADGNRKQRLVVNCVEAEN